ncbi:MAG: OadG family protein [Lachnospiraceae bacterium]|nr:OadG family protein [Lachnospiraceae bacterium]
MMIALCFSLTACGAQKGLPYEYNKDDLVYDAESMLEQFMQATEPQRKYIMAEGDEVYSKAVESLITAENESGEFVELKDTEVTETDDDIRVKLILKFQKNDVEAQFVYEPNGAYEYREIYQNPEGVLPYKATEITIQSSYPKSYYIRQAGMNTLMGMGTVFAVLIFIALIIYCFKFIAIIQKKADAKKVAKENAKVSAELSKAPVSKPSEPVYEEENLMDDEELVAVITAAVYAAAGVGSVCTDSKDTLIVRSISRARR